MCHRTLCSERYRMEKATPASSATSALRQPAFGKKAVEDTRALPVDMRRHSPQRRRGLYVAFAE
eukprot:2101442-Pleurochrysis_carterae.AAC.2